ncbi:hypothetical protein CMI47_18585 [Candidatus Pacearchaeota archaeon]|nr:hypothetical protein [Candidatus Pacearchaeota archaeon]
MIPAIRRELSRCLIRDFEITYEKVGEALGISKAAVSQYLKGKRAAKISLPDQTEKEIMKSCKALIDNKSDSVAEIQRLLNFIRDKRLSCEVCGKMKEGVLDDCKEFKFDGNNYK